MAELGAVLALDSPVDLALANALPNFALDLSQEQYAFVSRWVR